MQKLVIASHNQGKVAEIAELLAPLGFDVISAATLQLAEPEETGESFAENAILKARAAAIASGYHALADDSGLCVPALDGSPGIYSARWAGANKDFTLASQRIQEELLAKGLTVSGQSAYFICVLALCTPKGEVEIFEGRIDGTLRFPASGTKGFGYDPVFVPEGYAITFAEMDSNTKQNISHRARAFEKLKTYLER